MSIFGQSVALTNTEVYLDMENGDAYTKAFG